MLHLVDGFGLLEFGEFLDPPIVEQAIVQPVLVDRGQLFLERLVQELEDLGVALHGKCLRRVAPMAMRCSARAVKVPPSRHPRAGGGPAALSGEKAGKSGIPAFAGMTGAGYATARR